MHISMPSRFEQSVERTWFLAVPSDMLRKEGNLFRSVICTVKRSSQHHPRLFPVGEPIPINEAWDGIERFSQFKQFERRPNRFRHRYSQVNSQDWPEQEWPSFEGFEESVGIFHDEW